MVGPVWLLLDAAAAAAAVDCGALKCPIFQSFAVSSTKPASSGVASACCFVSLESVIPLAVVCSRRSQLYLVAPVSLGPQRIHHCKTCQEIIFCQIEFSFEQCF